MWIAVEKFGMTLLSLTTFFIYAKLLNPFEFGMAVLALSIGQGLALIFGSLFQDALVQHQSPTSHHFDTAFVAGISISALLSLFVLLICYLLNLEQALINLIAFSLLHIVLVSVSSVYVAILRREGRFDTLAKFSLLSRVVGATAGIGMALNGMGSLAVVAQSVMIELVGLAYLIINSKHRMGLRIKRDCFIELCSFGSMLSLRRMSWDVSIRGIPIVLGMSAGTAAVGLFGFAWRLVEMPRSAIASGLLSYALPVFSRRQHQKKELCQLFQNSTKFTAMIVTPLFVGLALVAPTLIPWLFDDKWIEAIVPTQLMAIVAVLSMARIYVPVSFTAVARPSTALFSDIVASIVALTITALFGASHGVMAAVFALMVRILVTLPFTMKGYTNIFGLSWVNQIRPLTAAWFASLGMATAVLTFLQLIELTPAILFAASATIGVISYLLIICVVYPSWHKDFRQFLSR